MNGPNSDIYQFTETKLWSELKNGSAEALKELFHRYYDELYFYGLKICKDEPQTTDSIQNVFAQLWESRQKLSDVTHVKAYLFRMLRNDLLKAQNRSIVNSLFPDVEESPETDFLLSQEDYIIEQETQTNRAALIERLLNELTPKQREVLYLRFYCNLSIAEIAETQNTEKQSVSNTLNRSLKVLREKISLVFSCWFLVFSSCRGL